MGQNRRVGEGNKSTSFHFDVNYLIAFGVLGYCEVDGNLIQLQGQQYILSFVAPSTMDMHK